MIDVQPSELRDIIAENIHNRRIELGITQSALAESVGLTQGRIAQIESANGGIPSESLAGFASALRTTPAALVTPGNFSQISA